MDARTLLVLALVAGLGYGGLFAARALDGDLLPASAVGCPDPEAPIVALRHADAEGTSYEVAWLRSGPVPLAGLRYHFAPVYGGPSDEAWGDVGDERLRVVHNGTPEATLDVGDVLRAAPFLSGRLDLLDAQGRDLGGEQRGRVVVTPDASSFRRGGFVGAAFELENPSPVPLVGHFGSHDARVYHVGFDGRLRGVLGQSSIVDHDFSFPPTTLAQGERAWLGSLSWDGVLRPQERPAPAGDYLVLVTHGAFCGVGRFTLREA